MTRCVLCAVLMLVLARATPARPPELKHLLPSGAQRGQTVEVKAVGSFDPWPVKVWVRGRGVTVSTAEEPGSLRIRVAEDSPVGLAWIRLHNEEGASALRPFVIGAIPEVMEVEPNNDPATAQVIELPTVTINGRLERGGDVDGFAVTLESGQTLVASMVANNVLGSPMDATLQIATPDGFVLAHVDDDQGLDPRLVFTAPEAGTYIVRTFAFPATPDSSIRFAGSDDYVYRLTLTTGGYADHAHPLAIALDAPARIEVRGWNLPEEGFALPVASYPVTDGLLRVEHAALANSLPIPVVAHRTIVEPAADISPDAAPLEAPISISGHLEPPGDRDAYRLQARKGETLHLRVAARSLGSPVDPVLRVLDGSGKVLGRNDDASRQDRDAELSFAPPEDGVYTVEVTDLNDRGGPRHAYRLDATRPEPDFRLTARSDRFAVQADKPLEIPIAVERRHGFAQPIEITLVREGLPLGLQAPPVSSCPEDDSAKGVTLTPIGPEVDPWSGTFRIQGRVLGDSGPTRAVEFALDGLDTTSDEAWLTVLRRADASETKAEASAPE